VNRGLFVLMFRGEARIINGIVDAKRIALYRKIRWLKLLQFP
jgi:hypothetical protein